MKKFLKEFGAFIKRGNVLDLAVAVIIGGAFSKIVNSLVKDILTPVLSLVIGRSGFANYKFVITPADPLTGVAENAITYGVFIQNILDFVVIALVIFVIIRLINRANRLFEERKAKEAAAAILAAPSPVAPAVPVPTPTEALLSDIKKLLEASLQKDKE